MTDSTSLSYCVESSIFAIDLRATLHVHPLIPCHYHACFMRTHWFHVIIMLALCVLALCAPHKKLKAKNKVFHLNQHRCDDQKVWKVTDKGRKKESMLVGLNGWCCLQVQVCECCHRYHWIHWYQYEARREHLTLQDSQIGALASSFRPKKDFFKTLYRGPCYVLNGIINLHTGKSTHDAIERAIYARL